MARHLGESSRHDESRRRHWRACIAALLAIALSMLAGCDSLLVLAGVRMRRRDVPLQSIEVSLGDSRGLVPGGSAQLSAVAHTVDGRTLAMAGTAGGKVLPSSFRFEAGVVTVDRSGVVTLPEDPRLSEGRN